MESPNVPDSLKDESAKSAEEAIKETALRESEQSTHDAVRQQIDQTIPRDE